MGPLCIKCNLLHGACTTVQPSCPKYTLVSHTVMYYILLLHYVSTLQTPCHWFARDRKDRKSRQAANTMFLYSVRVIISATLLLLPAFNEINTEVNTVCSHTMGSCNVCNKKQRLPYMVKGVYILYVFCCSTLLKPLPLHHPNLSSFFSLRI